MDKDLKANTSGGNFNTELKRIVDSRPSGNELNAYNKLFGSKYIVGSMVPRSEIGKVLKNFEYAGVKLDAIQGRNGYMEFGGTFKGYPIMRPYHAAYYDSANDRIVNVQREIVRVNVSKDYKGPQPVVVKLKGSDKLYRMDDAVKASNEAEWLNALKEYKPKNK